MIFGEMNSVRIENVEMVEMRGIEPYRHSVI